MPIKTIDQFKCEGCGACDRACPDDVIRMMNSKAQIVYPEDCCTCYLCYVVCPREAIEIIPAKHAKDIPYKIP